MKWAETAAHVAVWVSCCILGVNGALPGWGALVGALVGSVMMKTGGEKKPPKGG